MADDTYDQFAHDLPAAVHDWVNDNHVVLLLTTGGFTATNVFIADVLAGAAVEASDASYSRYVPTTEAINTSGGQAQLSSETFDFGALNNETPVAMVIAKTVTNDADSPVIAYHDTGFGAAANGAGYTVPAPASGFVTVGAV